MATVVTGEYLSSLKVQLTHEDSGATITTSAPKDNAGDGSLFSPTDLVAGALGACVLTTVAIAAERKGVDVSGMKVRVEKHMIDAPRRIGRLPVWVHLPRHLSPEERTRLEAIAKGCPVHRALGEDVESEVVFTYDV